MAISNGELAALVFFLNLVLGVSAWFAKSTLADLKKTLLAVLNEVRKTNGNVIRLDQAITDHDRLDDQRFEALEKQLDKIL